LEPLLPLPLPLPLPLLLPPLDPDPELELEEPEEPIELVLCDAEAEVELLVWPVSSDDPVLEDPEALVVVAEAAAPVPAAVLGRVVGTVTLLRAHVEAN